MCSAAPCHVIKQCLLLVFLILLSGCQSRVPVTPTGALFEQNHWQVKARVALRTPDDNVSATLKWQKIGQDFDFHLYGTFGITYAHLTQKDHLATLTLSEEQVYYHQDAEQLLYQSLGWEFPIDALSYWIKGLPSGKSGETVSRNDQGQLDTASLNLWQVKFSRYQKYSGYNMPRIITATHPQLRIKVVVKDWEFLPGERG